MNDYERRLRALGERARDDERELAPRPAALRRIRRRRLVASTGVVACVATIAAASALALTSRGGDGSVVTPLPPAAESPAPESGRCAPVPFEPTFVPEGFGRRWELSRDGTRPGLIRVLYSRQPASIELTTTQYAFFQTRPREIEVLGAPATIGAIHEGFSVELRYDGCDYALNGYGVTRSELERFATGLRPLRDDPARESVAGVWPEDTAEAAEEACKTATGREREAPQVVSRFAIDVLGWESPIYEAPSTPSGPWTVRPSAPDTYGGDVSAGVQIWTVEIAPDCAAIRSVSRLADRRPTGVGVSVEGRVVGIGYDPLGATTATIEVGYGGRTRTVEDRRNLGYVQMRLGYRPDTTGHFLVLLRDAAGGVFTAYGVPLPKGDFAAG